jgi:hypothetical protein
MHNIHAFSTSIQVEPVRTYDIIITTMFIPPNFPQKSASVISSTSGWMMAAKPSQKPLLLLLAGIDGHTEKISLCLELPLLNEHVEILAYSLLLLASKQSRSSQSFGFSCCCCTCCMYVGLWIMDPLL